EKVSTAYARTASLSLEGSEFSLHFIKHCGSYFSTDLWSDYLHRNAPDMMASLAASARVEPRVATPRQFHVLGMAKSSLDLKGAKHQKLELDFLRLAYAVRDLREAGDDAIGYLLVLVPELKRAAEGWKNKYSTGDGVVVLCRGIEGPALESLLREKADNALGLIQEMKLDKAERSLSLANLGKELGETSLASEIEELHPGIQNLTDREPTSLPLKVAWDYYGTLPTET
ncbi:MAG: hypothetical protein KDN05_19625, partial [Verrucomicrobiae bacterium]|nr:hypothetical protein [Verrucomicrobiae bacterium]